MNTREVAQGGLLTALTVALLWFGSVLPSANLSCCVLAGVASAVPLMRRGRVRLSLLIYVASGMLTVLLLPRKLPAVLYLGGFGLYPIIKYAIESRCPRKWQMAVKLAFGNLCLLLLAALFRAGLLAVTGAPLFLLPVDARAQLVAGWLAVNAVFWVYDRGLSGLISFLRRRLPPDV